MACQRLPILRRLFRLMSEHILPTPNIAPPSLHTMQGVLGNATVQPREYHVCIRGCARFAYAPRDRWHEHKEDRCPVCQETRFIEKMSARGEPLLRARKVRRISLHMLWIGSAC